MKKRLKRFRILPMASSVLSRASSMRLISFPALKGEYWKTVFPGASL